jgi:hypothetical protein
MNDHSMKPRPDDDGFGGSHRSGRLIRGLRIGWNLEWTDQDGCAPPSELLIPSLRRILQKWKDGKAEVIDTFPLPDPDLLNSAIPVCEWEIGLDGKPTPPWQHTVVAYGVDDKGGGTYTYVSATVGAHIAIDQLDEAVETKRMLAGGQVVPKVRLSDKPMRTKFGMKSRPHFEIVDWWTPPGGVGALRATPPLLLPNEVAAPATAEPVRATAEPAPAQPAPVEHVPVAETQPPAGRKRGTIEITTGKSAKSKIRLDVEARRPDLKQTLDDGLDSLPFGE